MTNDPKSKAYSDEESKLVPEIQDWNGGEGISIEDWISCVGNYQHAIGYVTLFWPKFVIYDGCLLRDGFSIENYEAFVTQTNGDKQAVESVMNHIHLIDLFSVNDEELVEGHLIFLGCMLTEMWQAKISKAFPDLQVIVHFEKENIEWLEDYQITVYQERISL